MRFSGMTDKAIQEELGARIQRERLNRNQTQAELAAAAGVAERTVRYLEGGRQASLETLIRILRALGKLDGFDALLPEPGLSPLQLAKLKGRERKRAQGSRGKSKSGGG